MKNCTVLIALLSIISVSCKDYSERDVQRLRHFISTSWHASVKYNPEDCGTLIGLPFPYTVPSVSDTFQELYYWDTFFTNEGLVRDGEVGQAQNNVDDMLYMVERFGMMPNGSRTWYTNRSQPPYLSMMVARVFEYTGDDEWLEAAYETLRKEYDFWQRERMTPVGLNRYSSAADDDLVAEFVLTGGKRLGVDFHSQGLSVEELYRLGRNFAAEAESGWDFNPRFDRRCEDFCPIDLNANLYMYEMNFARFAQRLGREAERDVWLEAAAARRERIMRYCYDEQRRMFFDYDYVNDRRSDVVSAAVFSLLYARVVEERYAADVARALDVLEYDYGIAACEDKPYDYVYQWSYPNAWAPIVYIAAAGLDNYGFRREARRIARKYVAAQIGMFRDTGCLWEKYNACDGTVNVNNEYEMPPMLGWSAGTFVYLTDMLDGKIE